jgi:hypothetical protein
MFKMPNWNLERPAMSVIPLNATPMSAKSETLALAHLEQTIHLIRGQKVLLDRDLAVLYGIETKYLNRAVRRNIKRFPADFMFTLTREEAQSSRFQLAP